MTGQMKRVKNGGPGRGPKLILAVAAVLVMISATTVQAAFFDTAGKSARSVGMGETFLATAGDATSYWYNPAGLSHVEKRQVGLSYGIPMATVSDLTISQINFVTKLGENRGLGVGLSYGGIDVANDMVISAGYGMALSEKLAVGGNVKIMRWSVDGQNIRGGAGKDDDLSKTSFSLDLSATMGLGEWFGLGAFSTGVYVKDAIMPNISESGDDGGKVPVEAGIGLMSKSDLFTGEIDVAMKDGNTFIRAGGEAPLPGSNLGLRAGLIYGSDFKDDTERFDVDLGLGYNFGSIQFNYAFVIPVEVANSGGKHFFSFGIGF
jgi:hypothetical protein